MLDKGVTKDPMQDQAMFVPLEPGDLLLWDSRLVHAGSVGDCAQSGELARASLCVCMGPRSRASTEVLERRRQALTEGWCFSHWPWEATVKSVGDVTGYYHPNLSEEQWELV